MAKLTNAQLISRVALLEAEIQRLKDEKVAENKLAKETTGCDTWRLAYHMVAQELINLKGENEPAQQENTKPEIFKVHIDRTVMGMRWILGLVDFQVTCSDEFLANFEIWHNQDKSWVAFVPKNVTGETQRFNSAFNKARHAKGIKGNYYKNTGSFMNLK